MDEDEKYNRKLEVGLYTLQVADLFFTLIRVLVLLLFESPRMCSNVIISLIMQLIAVILGHLWTSEYVSAPDISISFQSI